jgi:hypothetical protein
MIASARALGLPDERDVIAALEPALEPDPRGPGKMHARDVIHYGQRPDGSWLMRESGSIAHGDIDDFSRCFLLGGHEFSTGSQLAHSVLGMVPASLRCPSGRMSADYFRYSPGTGTGSHQDGFGDLIMIWTLDRTGDGGESYLKALDGREVLRRALIPGELLIFRDEMFYHGLTPVQGTRDALIFITLRDGA